MRELPILFCDEMVRAVRAGTKTQTRRIVKPQPEFDATPQQVEDKWHWRAQVRILGGEPFEITAEFKPRYRPGDRLWVREGVWCWSNLARGRNGGLRWPDLEGEAAASWLDKSCEYTSDSPPAFYRNAIDGSPLNKMFMPRWAARTVLDVVSVRCERLQDISEGDAKAEGCTDSMGQVMSREGVPFESCSLTARDNYWSLWERINGRGSWAANPWVWVYTFKLAEVAP